MAQPRLFCPICLERDPHSSAPLYPRCKPFHLPIPTAEPALLPADCGVCALAPDAFTALPLRRITPYNHDTSLLVFALPTPDTHLHLPPLTHLIVRAPDCEHGGGDAERAYTSVSPPNVAGSFCIMVKRYQAWGDPAFAQRRQRLARGEWRGGVGGACGQRGRRRGGLLGLAAYGGCR